MHPRQGGPPLTAVDLSRVTIGSLRQIVEETEYFGFPTVLNKESQLLSGYITRKDVQYVLGEWFV